SIASSSSINDAVARWRSIVASVSLSTSSWNDALFAATYPSSCSPPGDCPVTRWYPTGRAEKRSACSPPVTRSCGAADHGARVDLDATRPQDQHAVVLLGRAHQCDSVTHVGRTEPALPSQPLEE